MPKFNHTYYLAFEITSNDENGEDITGLDLRKALQARMDDLSDNDMFKVCGWSSTLEIEDADA